MLLGLKVFFRFPVIYWIPRFSFFFGPGILFKRRIRFTTEWLIVGIEILMQRSP